jgi:lipoprotein-releasing system ATP-binding protein
MNDATAPLLAARSLVKDYQFGGSKLRVLDGVDLEVRRGETVAIVGHSGAGKSTLLHLLGLLDRPTGGEVSYDGRAVSAASPLERARLRRRHVGFVFQFYHLIAELSALENVLLARMLDASPLEWWKRRAAEKRRATELLGRLGLGARLAHRPAQLSGGERQRVAIARALVSDPDLVLCDEPTGNLDERTAREIVDLLFELQATTGKTFVIVTHDLDLAARADRTLTIAAGRIAGETLAVSSGAAGRAAPPDDPGSP